MENGAKKEERSEGINLTRGELGLVLRSEAKRYRREIYEMLSYEELEGYFPALKEARDRTHRLANIFRHKDITGAVTGYFREREAQGVERGGRERKKKREELTQELKVRAEELRRAPLMVEMGRETGYEIWAEYGTWKSALRNAGIKELTPAEHERAVREYGIGAASPRLIRKDYERQIIRENRIKFNKREQEALITVCEIAREKKRAPQPEELPAEVQEIIKVFTCSYTDLLSHMGIILHHRPELPSKLGKKRRNK